MIASNHLITGAVIGASIQNPWLALPLAFLSHFGLDVLPHFGFTKSGFTHALTQRISYIALFLDVIFTAGLVVMLQTTNWLPYMAAFVAFSPDTIWLTNYFVYERRKLPSPDFLRGPLTRFHKRIQWCERPWGLIVDGLWFAAMLVILTRII